MSVQQILRKPGQWNLKLTADSPPGILASLDYFGHIAVIPGRVNPVERGDECLTLARFVGPLRDVSTDPTGPTLSGLSMNAWLGDEDGKGDVIEYPGITLTGVTFAAAIRALLPSHGAVTEGTLTNPTAGTYTGTHNYQSPRSAIDYVCDLYGADWRVNGNGTLDAGPPSALFRIPSSAPGTGTLLTDDFATADTSKWNGYGSGAAVVTGQAVITPTSGYPALVATRAYDFRAASLTVQLVQAPNVGNGTTEAIVMVEATTPGSGDRLVVTVSPGGNITFAETTGFTPDAGAVSIPYNSTAHKWIRIGLDSTGSTAYFATSPDGVTWTTRRTMATVRHYPVANRDAYFLSV